MSEQRPPRRPRPRSATPPARRARRGDPSRLAAYTLLRAVDDGAYANLELPKILTRQRLHGRDAAFATELSFGTIRWCGLYDRIIELAASRPVDRLDPGVRDTLRLGAHQLFGMRVPDHAAADQTVALARAVNGAGAASLVNAVMRRLSERSREEWAGEVIPADDATARVAVAQSHPEWIVRALRQALIGHGRATAATVDDQLECLLVCDNEPPTVALVARPGLSTVTDLVHAGATPSLVSPIGARLPGGVPGDIPAIREGRAAVQDEGSQVLALALAAVNVPPGPRARERWLDLSAGPGGKAGVLAGLAGQHAQFPGGGAKDEARADLVCVEVSEHRSDLVRSTLRPAIEQSGGLGVSIEVRTQDGREVGQAEPAAYDRVLVDAPCTGLGALRRRPEARWRRSPADLATLGPLQRALLASAIDATRPGGIIAYSTCSPHLAETRFVIDDVLKHRRDVELVDARDVVTEVSQAALTDLGCGPTVQLWPHVHGTDGMFLALLRKLDAG
ncbi:MAG: RsmB/NOP family class I SAM-dependent RNA methyltransferase [Nostocoides sp.]